MAEISSKKGIAFASLILFSLIFLSFGYAADFESNVTPTSINEDEEVLLNFTINNIDTTKNITQVNITLPTDFSFVEDSNGTTASGATFSHTSTTLNWTNTTTEGFIESGTEEYFWFNVTATQPGTYNVTIDTLDTSNSSSSTNVTITVENTPYTGCVNLSDNSTFQNKISGNFSSGFEINDSISLCTGSYTFYSGPSFFLEIVSDNLVIDGNNSQFQGGGAVLYVESQDNVTIKNFNVIYSDYGIYLNSSSNVKILNNNIVSSFTNGIYLFSSSDNTIQYNNISKNQNGIYLFSSSNNTMMYNNASGNWNVGIYLDSGSDNTIQYNNISGNQNGIYLFSSSNNTIGNNTANSNNNCGISLESSSNNTIGNNTASDNSYSGISLQSSSNNTIGNNTANSNVNGIYLESSSNNIIGNNTASDNSYSGIYLESSSNNTIGNNTASDNSYSGISLQSSSNNNKIESNTANSNNNVGIYLQSSSNNTIGNNTANSNLFGIYLQFSSIFNTILNNTVSFNTVNGIYLQSSSNNTIGNNTANSNNNCGISLESSSNNTIGNNTANSNVNGISLRFSSNNTIGNNTASDNSYSGISLESSSNNTIGNNTANSNVFGIYLSSSSNNTIRQNNESLSYYGFYLSSSSNNTIHNNLAELNVYGIYLESSSDNNFSNFDFNHNLKSSVLDSQILDESIERTFPKNQETTLVFNTIYPNGTSWTDYNYSLLFYPELSYTVINNSDNFSIKFTPEKEGIYTLSLNVSVGHNNEVRNIVFLVGEPSLGSERYYMYEEFPTKGQPAFGSDTGSMYPNEPTDAQERSSDGLVQYSPNEIVNIYPIIKNVSVGLFYSSNETGSLGIEKYAKYGSTKDYETELNSTGEGNYDFAVKNFTNINITSDYAWRFYWLAFKVNGSQISVISNDTGKTYADFDYLYAGPEIIYFGESSGSDIRNIRLLSSVFNDDSGRSVTLEFDGDGSLDLVLNLSDDNYTIFYDDIPCNDNENCTLNLKNNGEINLTLKLGSYHKLDVVGTIPPEIPSSGSSGTTYPTYRIDEEELSNGYQKVMRKNWRILFRIDGESHTFKVEDVTKTTAKISISSETQEAILSIGEEKKFEITGDDYYDILVRLNSIDSTNEIYLKANFTIQSIHEEIIPLEEEEIEEEINETEEIIEEPIEEEPIEEEETIPEEVEEEINETIDEIPQETIHELEKEKMKLTALLIAMFIIVILIIFMFIYRRSGKE